MEQANAVIIGGGVVGCAIARAFSKDWSDVFLLAALPKFGRCAGNIVSSCVPGRTFLVSGRAEDFASSNTANHNLNCSRRTLCLILRQGSFHPVKLGRITRERRAPNMEFIGLQPDF